MSLAAAGGSVVFDLGSFLGATARRIAQKDTVAKTVCVEALPHLATQTELLNDGHPKLTVVNRAVSRAVATETMYVTPVPYGSSLRRPRRRVLGAVDVMQISVPTTTVDQLLADHPATGPVFIRADVCGAENALLAGSAATLQRKAVAAWWFKVCLEDLYESQTPVQEIMGPLAAAGYKVSGVMPLGRKPGLTYQYGEFTAFLPPYVIDASEIFAA